MSVLNKTGGGSFGYPSSVDIKTIVRQKVREGCTMPTIAAVSKTALHALEESACKYIPVHIYGARRTELLAERPDNNVPESIIVDCMKLDNNGDYIANYSIAAKRNLKDKGIRSAKLFRKIAVDAYFDYLYDNRGLQLCENTGFARDKKTIHRIETALLLYSTFGEKRVVKKLCKNDGFNSVYRALRTDVVNALDSVQKYAYYMRPDDPMNRSEDTAGRLGDLLLYVSLLYRLLLHFVDKIDGLIITSMDQRTPVLVPREETDPENLFMQYVCDGAELRASGGMTSLRKYTYRSVMELIKLFTLIITVPIQRKENFTNIIVAAVDSLTLVHHHCQYILNLSLSGYVCWLKGGINDEYMISAMKQQGRFIFYMEKVAPTASSRSWSGMEVGTSMWFNMAIASALIKHGGPTPHYLLTVNDEYDTFNGPNNHTPNQKPDYDRDSKNAKPADIIPSGVLLFCTRSTSSEAIVSKFDKTGSMEHRRSRIYQRGLPVTDNENVTSDLRPDTSFSCSFDGDKYLSLDGESSTELSFNGFSNFTFTKDGEYWYDVDSTAESHPVSQKCRSESLTRINHGSSCKCEQPAEPIEREDHGSSCKREQPEDSTGHEIYMTMENIAARQNKQSSPDPSFESTLSCHAKKRTSDNYMWLNDDGWSSYPCNIQGGKRSINIPVEHEFISDDDHDNYNPRRSGRRTIGIVNWKGDTVIYDVPSRVMKDK